MKRNSGRNPRWVGLVIAAALGVGLMAYGGSFLVVDQPRPSDVILVLAGETSRRPQRALELLAQGYGKRIVLDVPNNTMIFEFTEIDLARRYVQDLPQRASITICPIDGLSTKDESKDAEKCLARDGGRSVLLVTSDHHTRRALSVFRNELPGHEYSVAAARDDEQFGVRWWTHRQWAKTFLDEWLRLIWWKLIDQWR